MGDESTIAKSGELYIEEKRFLKTSWAKRFCVLYKKTTDCHGYMELYDDKKAFTQHKKKSKKCERRIELYNIESIKSSSESSGKGNEYHIEIRSRFHKHNLMFRNERDFNDWFAMLQATADIAERGPGENSASYSADLENDYSDEWSDSDLSDDESYGDVITLNQMYASVDTVSVQIFEVEVEPSDLAKICDIEGKMTLLVGNNEITFEDPNTKRVKYSFKLPWMRRFGKYKTQSFNFEVGRKCPNGEGSVTFITPSAKLIHRILTQKSSSRSKLVIPHSHTEDETNCKEIKSSRPSVNSIQEILEESPPPVKERQLPVVSQPVVPGGIVRQNPGQPVVPGGIVRKNPGQPVVPGGIVRNNPGQPVAPGGIARNNPGQPVVPGGIARNNPGQPDVPGGIVRQNHGQPVVPGGITRNNPGQPVVPGGIGRKNPGQPVVPGGIARNNPGQPVVPGGIARNNPGQPDVPGGIVRKNLGQPVVPGGIARNNPGQPVVPGGIARNNPGQPDVPGGIARNNPGQPVVPGGIARNNPGQPDVPGGIVRKNLGQPDVPGGIARNNSGQPVVPGGIVRGKANTPVIKKYTNVEGSVTCVTPSYELIHKTTLVTQEKKLQAYEDIANRSSDSEI